jgi:hypothetical protein
MSKLRYDGNLVGHLIADTTQLGFEKLPQGSVLYIEGLAEDALSIVGNRGTTYDSLPEAERLRLAGFLWRPRKERPLTFWEKMNILYPDLVKQIPAETLNVDWPLEYDGKALRRMTRTLIEAEGLEIPHDETINELWRDRGWWDYVSKKPSGEDSGGGKGRIIHEQKLYIAYFNQPPDIEALIADIREYTEEPYNLDRIMSVAAKVMPKRADLSRLHYFRMDAKEVDRAVLLQKAIEGEPLL